MPVVRPEPDDPFRVLILGDFSGSGAGGRKPLRVDRDNFDKVLRDLGLHVEIAFGNGQFSDADLKFERLDDFEPDSIYLRSELFSHLNVREQSNEHSQEVEEAPAIRMPSAEDLARLTSRGNLLDAAVEQTTAVASAADEWQATVDRIVARYGTPRESADKARASAERTQRASMLMCSILHDARFQAIEAAWRGLDFLVRHLDSDLIQLYIFDISKDRLAADLNASDIFKDESWSVIAGIYAFDRTVVQDVLLLKRLAQIAMNIDAPFIGECVPSQKENAKAAAAWQELRKSPEARWLALAMPRFLLRLPYGKDTSTIESFEFEEMPGAPKHHEYLWGNPAFACIFVLGRLFSDSGWKMRPAQNECIEGVPLHVYKLNGETHTQPCAEVMLSEHDCAALLKEGLLPLASMKDRDTVRIPRVQSIADPPTALVGKWLN